MSHSRSRSQAPIALAPGEERRRSQRVIIRIAVNVYFIQMNRAETISAHTLAVNDHGALLLCSRSFPSGSSLEIENERTRERMKCKVTRSPQRTPEGFQVPVAFESASPGFWHISFPPTDWKPTDL